MSDSLANGAGKIEGGIVTAAVLVIGDEILSGRTKDKNIGYIAEYLTASASISKRSESFQTRSRKSSLR